MLNLYFIELEVRDNGRGLKQEIREGIGLGSMKERAAELGGRCQVESLAECGTRVLVRLPFVVEDTRED